MGKRKRVTETSQRPKKFKQWSDESMLQAIEAIKEGTLGLNEASRSYQVYRSTLKDKITGRVMHGEKSGPKPYLFSEEEKELVTFLKQAASIGYRKTKREVAACNGSKDGRKERR